MELISHNDPWRRCKSNDRQSILFGDFEGCGYNYIVIRVDISVFPYALQEMCFICSVWMIGEGASAAVSGSFHGLFCNVFSFFFEWYWSNSTWGRKNWNHLMSISFVLPVIQIWHLLWYTIQICSHLQWFLKLAPFPFVLNFRCCQVMPGIKCSCDFWSPELNVLATEVLFNFITWHLLLKWRTKAETQGSPGECTKKGTLRTNLLPIKDSEKHAFCVAFLECFCAQSLGDYVKYKCLSAKGGCSV